MFFIRIILLLHILNKKNKQTAQNNHLGHYSKIIVENINHPVFSNINQDEWYSLVYCLSGSKHITYEYDGDRISNISLTHIGRHYILYAVAAFCKSVALPIAMAAITTLVTLYLTK